MYFRHYFVVRGARSFHVQALGQVQDLRLEKCTRRTDDDLQRQAFHRAFFFCFFLLILRSILVLTIFFAVTLSKAELPAWMDWILAAYVVFYVVIHLILSVSDRLQCHACRRGVVAAHRARRRVFTRLFTRVCFRFRYPVVWVRNPVACASTRSPWKTCTTEGARWVTNSTRTHR